MNSLRKTLLITSLALLCAPRLYAAQPGYPEAAAPWSARQALTLPKAMTPEFLGAVAAERGPDAAAKLAEKKAKVSELLIRYRNCGLKPADAVTAAKYLVPEFASEIRYLAEGGCEELKAAAKPGKAAAAAAGRLENIRASALSGDLATAEGSARFFDGSSTRGAVAVTAVSGRAAPSPAAVQKPSSRPLASRVPAVSAPFRAAGAVQRPPEVGYGRVNQAVDFWAKMRRENWRALRGGDLKGTEKAKAFGKAAAGAVFGGLLFYSNLPAVEKAAANLRWDVSNGQSRGVIAADSVKLVFHCGVTMLALAPIPVLKVARAAVSGEAWAIALLAAFAAGPVNRAVHFAD
ncbi:MAG: hypothetical protein M0025_08720 [Elusimicrobia bacterium]|nr:hypothetical protein [Elusimicrobiota bacterium]